MVQKTAKNKKLGFTVWALSTVAGADKDVLRECPHSDRTYISLIGFMLLLAGAVLFAIAFGAVLASKIASTNDEKIYLGIICAAVALTVLAVDRAFIMADWFSYASQKPDGGLREPALSDRAKRFTAIITRILLSVAIAFVFSTLAETYLYRDDINKIIEENHLAENASIYAERDSYEAELDAEIEASRSSLSALDQAVSAATEAQLAAAQGEASDSVTVGNLREQIDDANLRIENLREQRDRERRRAREQSDLAQAEQYGDQGTSTTGQQLSGIAGCGPRCERASGNARAALAEVYRLSEEILQIENSRDADLEAIESAQANALAQRAAQIEISKDALVRAIADRDAEAELLNQLQANYEISLSSRTQFLEDQPGFVPKSEGLAARFQALHIVYDTYGITREVIALKLFIMMLEMAPFLIKVLASPRTFYAVELNRRIATASYESEIERLEKNSEFLAKDYEAFEKRRDWERRADTEDIANEAMRRAAGDYK
ncbi:MAG: DUF4407 domain-containing protein [Pseudomonadota bacterium]